MDDLRHISRQPIDIERSFILGVITFRELLFSEHIALIVDISKEGLGIETEDIIEPGFVWFKERVGGHRGGIMMWSRRFGPRFRAGIKFVPLSHFEEHYVQEQIGKTGPHRPLRDPETILRPLIESIKKSGA